jgi:hypothetical protein
MMGSFAKGSVPKYTEKPSYTERKRIDRHEIHGILGEGDATSLIDN